MIAPSLCSLRRDFLEAVAAGIDRPVMFVNWKREVCWRDGNGYVQWAHLGTYCEPETRTMNPDGQGWRAFKRPWIVRISLNTHYLGSMPKVCRALNALECHHHRSFELSALPKQVMALAPWVIAFSHGLEEWQAAGHPDKTPLPNAPVTLDFYGGRSYGCSYAWTKRAQRLMNEFENALKAHGQRLRVRHDQ